jgi:hypothetical protein
MGLCCHAGQLRGCLGLDTGCISADAAAALIMSRSTAGDREYNIRMTNLLGGLDWWLLALPISAAPPGLQNPLDMLAAVLMCSFQVV